MKGFGPSFPNFAYLSDPASGNRAVPVSPRLYGVSFDPGYDASVHGTVYRRGDRETRKTHRNHRCLIGRLLLRDLQFGASVQYDPECVSYSRAEHGNRGL